MRVIGTAGHVDHGKSTLVRWLTGIDPDRLAEEKAREMTIDLGFAWLDLPNGLTVGIVDVPGHRDFIENMLAGVGAIDAALLVVAADEGVMPQTREHLAILDLLAIQSGIIVLTKIDVIDDLAWLELVEHDIADLVANTTLETAKVIRVSARANVGRAELVEALEALLSSAPSRTDYNHPRLSVDRVFTISGFGTVVTGTLLGGQLRVGDEVEIQPSGLRVRIRGLQSYNQSVEIAWPGSRVAVNLSGIEKKAISRGHVLAYPGQLQATTTLDVQFRHFNGSRRPLKHNEEVKLFIGAAEAVGRVRLLSDELLQPGAIGWLQIELARPLAVADRDRFILRYPSPSELIGGGIVVNAHPSRRWRRFQPQVIRDLETRIQGTPAERVIQAADQSEPVSYAVIQKHLGLGGDELNVAIQSALENGSLIELSENLFLARSRWESILNTMIRELQLYHQSEPLRRGMPREELRNRMGFSSATFNLILQSQNQIMTDGTVVRLEDHQIRFTDQQQAAIQLLMQQISSAPYTPPSYAEAEKLIGETVLIALIDLGQVVQVQPDVIFSREVYDEMVAAVLEIIDAAGEITASVLRDRFTTSRKYAIALLEHLDSIGVTRRRGDGRVRGPRAGQRPA